MDPNQLELRRHLPEMLHYAATCDEFFDTLIFNRDAHPIQLACELSERYDPNDSYPIIL